MPTFVDRKSLLPAGYSATETKTKESPKKVDEPKKPEAPKLTPPPTVKPESKPATPQTPKLFDLNEINRKF